MRFHDPTANLKELRTTAREFADASTEQTENDNPETDLALRDADVELQKAAIAWVASKLRERSYPNHPLLQYLVRLHESIR